MLWHVLDVRAIWVREFASALGRQVPTLGWMPKLSFAALFQNSEWEEFLPDPPLRMRHFPLQRGFARWPIKWLAGEGARLAGRLARQTQDTSTSPLVCCSPHYAAVAARWPGPVIYYVTDLFVGWGENPRRIRALDRQMCRAAELVCPNSKRIAQYLVAEAECPEEKIVVLPNATRAANLLAEPLRKPAGLPADIADLSRPVAGVIGNLAANMDWKLLEEAVDRTPWLSWLFVGSTEMPTLDAGQEKARSTLMARQGRIRFVGPKHYGVLKDYARALDVAILPYRKREPTSSGSCTRFYEHLAACRPMLATRGFEELLHKEPVLRLVDTAPEIVSELKRLRAAGFQDDFIELRWQASQTETWEARALAMRKALAERMPLVCTEAARPAVTREEAR